MKKKYIGGKKIEQNQNSKLIHNGEVIGRVIGINWANEAEDYFQQLYEKEFIKTEEKEDKRYVGGRKVIQE